MDTIEVFLGDEIEEGEWIHYAEDIEEIPDYMFEHEVNRRYVNVIDSADDYEVSYQ
jgi:hypothetical protein